MSEPDADPDAGGLPHGRAPGDVVDMLEQSAAWLDVHDRFHASLLPPAITYAAPPSPQAELRALAGWFAERPALAHIAWHDLVTGHRRGDRT